MEKIIYFDDPRKSWYAIFKIDLSFGLGFNITKSGVVIVAACFYFEAAKK